MWRTLVRGRLYGWGNVVFGLGWGGGDVVFGLMGDHPRLSSLRPPQGKSACR